MTKTVSDLKKEYPIDLSSGQTESLRGVNNPRKENIKVLRAAFPHLLAEGYVRDMPPYALGWFNEKLAEALENNKTVNPLNIVARQSRYDR